MGSSELVQDLVTGGSTQPLAKPCRAPSPLAHRSIEAFSGDTPQSTAKAALISHSIRTSRGATSSISAKTPHSRSGCKAIAIKLYSYFMTKDTQNTDALV